MLTRSVLYSDVRGGDPALRKRPTSVIGSILSLMAFQVKSLRTYITVAVLSMVVLSALRRFATTNLSRTMAPLSITLNDGRQIPWLGFGTGTALYGKNAANFVRVAIENGITHLDGAQIYGNEDTLGEGIAASGKPRSELFVTTKLAQVPEGKNVRDTLVESLKKLRLDYVDLFLIHMPIHHEGRLKPVWKEFEEIQKEGLAKSIGVSNFRVKDLKEVLEVATVIPAVNQVDVGGIRAPLTSTDLAIVIDRVPPVCVQGGASGSRASEET